MEIEIISRAEPPCPYCIAAKKFLEAKSIDYKETEAMEVLGFLRSKGIKTVPAVFINGEYLGGFNELKAYVGSLPEV